MKPKFSFLLPAYKKEFLRMSMESILNQNYKDFELIVVNDCSPENLTDVVNEFSDSRITYHINEKNIGGNNLVNQWNHCLNFASGEFVILASDDDIYQDTFLFKINELIEKYPRVNVFHTKVAIIDSNNDFIDFSQNCAEWESCLDFIWHKVCKHRLQFMPEFVLRLSALNEVGGYVDFPSAWGSDHATTFLLSKDNGVVCCNESLFYWRSSDLNVSSSGNFSSNKLKAIFYYMDWIQDFVKSNVFSKGNELIPLIEKGTLEYLQKRIPVLLVGHSYSHLTSLLIKGTFNQRNLARKLVTKGILKKILKLK